MGWGILGSLIDSQCLADAMDEKIKIVEAKTHDWGDPYCDGYLEALKDVRKFIADEPPGPSWDYGLAVDDSLTTG